MQFCPIIASVTRKQQNMNSREESLMRKGNMFKGAMARVFAGAMAAGMAMTSFAAGWQKNETGW